MESGSWVVNPSTRPPLVQAPGLNLLVKPRRDHTQRKRKRALPKLGAFKGQLRIGHLGTLRPFTSTHKAQFPLTLRNSQDITTRIAPHKKPHSERPCTLFCMQARILLQRDSRDSTVPRFSRVLHTDVLLLPSKTYIFFLVK